MTISLYGCGKTALEKGPVVVSDTSEDSIDISDQEKDHDNQADQEQQEQQEHQEQQDQQNHQSETEVNIEDTSEDTSSVDKNQDSSKNESNETFKGIIMLEGTEEEVNYRTYHSQFGYTMDYDVDRFTVTSENGIDTYIAENANPDLYPYVFIRITKSEYTEGKIEISGNIYVDDEKLNETLSTNVPNDNVKIGDYDAIHFKFIDGNEWNSLVKHIYIIILEKNYYVIETNYFLEASEGYGVRIKAMLDTLVIEE